CSPALRRRSADRPPVAPAHVPSAPLDAPSTTRHMEALRPGRRPMKSTACAKINLTLEVLGKRTDGFHEVATVLHTIDLADELTFEPAPTLSLAGDDAGTPVEENLVMRAARLLQQALGEKRGARIVLTKHIPVAAGLGGG